MGEGANAAQAEGLVPGQRYLVLGLENPSVSSERWLKCVAEWTKNVSPPYTELIWEPMRYLI